MADFLKDYEPVEDRLREFWSDHPGGRVMTEVLHHDGGDYIVKASVWREILKTYGGSEAQSWRDQPPDATGLAQDSVEKLPNNMKASALEVCETSAIGRALANLGYAAKGKRPSREEMSKSSLEPDVAPSTHDGMGEGGESDPRMGKARADSPQRTGDDAPVQAEGESERDAEPAKPPSASPEQEQIEAYIQVLRDGPGNTQSVLQARALFESDARKVRNLRDLTVDELLKVVQAFKDKVPA